MESTFACPSCLLLLIFWRRCQERPSQDHLSSGLVYRLGCGTLIKQTGLWDQVNWDRGAGPWCESALKGPTPLYTFAWPWWIYLSFPSFYNPSITHPQHINSHLSVLCPLFIPWSLITGLSTHSIIPLLPLLPFALHSSCWLAPPTQLSYPSLSLSLSLSVSYSNVLASHHLFVFSSAVDPLFSSFVCPPNRPSVSTTPCPPLLFHILSICSPGTSYQSHTRVTAQHCELGPRFYL